MNVTVRRADNCHWVALNWCIVLHRGTLEECQFTVQAVRIGSLESMEPLGKQVREKLPKRR